MLVISLVTALALAGAPPPDTAQPSHPEPVRKAIAEAHKRLKEALAKDSPADRIELREEPGPFGTVVAVAAVRGAYPGTGVRRLAIDAVTGTSYGKDGERTFADFAREHGWRAKPPATAELVRFLNIALFDGVAILDSDPAPRVTADKARLVIELVRRFMPSHAGEWLVITVASAGAERVERRPLQE